jgi:hypothetical protein
LLAQFMAETAHDADDNDQDGHTERHADDGNHGNN